MTSGQIARRKHRVLESDVDAKEETWVRGRGKRLITYVVLLEPVLEWLVRLLYF